MSTEPRTNDSLSASLSQPFDDVIRIVKDAFKAHGFGNLTEIDVKKTLREKIGEEIEPYTILGMCQPRIAFRAITAEHEIGLMMPCNVLVHECEGAVHVRAQDPMLMMQVTGNAALTQIATEARSLIEQAMSEIRM